MNFPVRWIVIVVLLCGIIVLSSCGFLWDRDKDPITIVMVGPLSGPSATVGKSFRQGIKLYIDAINRKGGIDDKRIVLEEKDDQNNRHLAAKKALEVVNEGRAVAVIGHHYSPCSISAGEIYKKYKIPAISPASSNVKVTEGNPWYFRSSFNDRIQGRFLATYVNQVLQAKNISIIHEDLEYGAQLSQTFEDALKEQGVDVKYKWRFEAEASDIDRQLRKIVNDIKSKDDAGIIFLSTHAKEGVKLLILMKEYLVQNTLVAPDAYASESFREGFEPYLVNSNKKPSYYTNGLYVTAPLIYDTTSEKGQQFQKAYSERFNEDAGWHAAFAYDSAMVLVEAIRRMGVRGQPKTIKEDRRKIREYLANLNSVSEAIEGATGYNYFDNEGNSQKPIFVGVYRNHNIISALTQFRAIPYLDETAKIPDINAVPDFEKARNENRILLFDDRYMFKINVVYTGVQINEISEIDIENFTCKIDFHLWFRYKGDIDIGDVTFLNAVTPVDLGKPIEQKTEGQIAYKLYRTQGKFRADFLPDQYEFGQHVLGFSFRHQKMDRNNLIYVKDILGMGISKNESPVEKLNMEKSLNPSLGWTIERAWFSQNTAEASSLGDPDHMSLEGGNVQYSRFNVGMLIVENKFSFQKFISSKHSGTIFIISVIVSLLLALAMIQHGFRHYPNLIPFSKITWLFQMFFVALSLWSAEMYLLDRLRYELSIQNLESITIAFRVIWWFTLAFFINLAIKRFMWLPLEEKTGRKIPNLIRHLCSIIIYLLALFGVVAFVFHQELTSLLATSGVIAMIVGLAVQMNIANIFSGIAMNLERPFRMGDWVKIGSYPEGRVMDINWRSTRIRTRDDTVISIPNNQTSESSIENFSYPTDGYWKYFTIRVEPHHPPERVKKILLDAALSADGVVTNDSSPATRFLGLTEGITSTSQPWAANYLVSVYTNDYGRKFAINESVWTQIWVHLKNAGIQIVTQRQEVNMSFMGIKRKKEKVDKPLAMLQDLDIFVPFSEEAKLYLSKKMRSHYLPPHEIVVRQGDPGDSLFIIVEGVLGVWAEFESKKSVEVARLGAGNFFGEMALLTGEPRTATIITITDTQLYEITKEDVLPLLKKQPDIFGALSDVLSERRLATESQKKMSKEKQIDKNTLTTQILTRIQEFFGFRKSS